MFKNDLSELDDSREVVDMLVQEYEAATKPNYLCWQGTIFLRIRMGLWLNRIISLQVVKALQLSKMNTAKM